MTVRPSGPGPPTPSPAQHPRRVRAGAGPGPGTGGRRWELSRSAHGLGMPGGRGSRKGFYLVLAAGS